MPALPTDLEEALTALEEDDVVRGWFAPNLLATHLASKRAELAAVAVADLDPLGQCERIGGVHRLH